MKAGLKFTGVGVVIFLINVCAMAQSFPPLRFGGQAIANIGTALPPFAFTNLILTESTNDSPVGGAGWLYSPTLILSNGFSAFFQFQMTPGSNAQGLAFTLAPGNQYSSQAIGRGGTGLGYDGISNCIAVAFVQQPSAALGQPAYPFVSIQSGAGAGKTNSANISHSLGISSNNPALNFADGKIHTAIVSFGPSSPPTNIAVFLDGGTAPVAQAPFSVSQLLAMTNGPFILGFTSANLPGQPVDTVVLDVGMLETTSPQLTVTVPSSIAVVGQPVVISVLASNGVPTAPGSLSVSNLPAGATAFPPLPLSGVGTLGSTINWTPSAAGTNQITFRATINGVTVSQSAAIVVYPAVDAGTTNQAFDLSVAGATTNLAAAGNAMLLTNAFRLTKTGAIHLPGAVWCKTQEPLLMGFDTHFQFQMGSGTNAEGLAFVIQNSSLTACGNADSSLGFGSIANSLAVELVPNPDTSIGDPNYPFVSVQSRFTLANSANFMYTLGSSSSLTGYLPPVNLADGQVHSVEIVLSPTNMPSSPRFLYVYVDGGYYLDGAPPANQPQCIVSMPIQFASMLSNGMAWVGLTSATGGAASNTDVLNWTFAPYVAPLVSVSPAIPTAVLSGSTVAFTVTGTEPQTNANAELIGMTLPSGAFMSPSLPLAINGGQSASSTFSWTAPVVTQPTTNRIAFAAAMLNGLQSFVSVDTVVYPPPTLGGLQYTNGNFGLGFSSVSNLSFTVLTSTNLLSNWTVLPALVTETSPGQYQVVDTNTPAAVQRFYRIRSP